MNTRTFEKVVFGLALVLLAFGYGYGARAFAWFPNSLVERAWHQARALSPIALQTPDFLSGRVYDRTGVRLTRPEKRQPGLTLIASNWRSFDWNPGLKLLDRHGQAVHEWSIQPEAVFGDAEKYKGVELKHQTIHAFHLFEDGDVLVNTDYVGLVRLNACGEVLWRLAERTHHSLAEGPDGTFWTPVRRYSDPGLPGVGSVLHDYLLEVDADGEIVRELPVLKILADHGLERFVAKFRLPHSGDYSHVNDVEPLSANLADEHPLFEAGDLLVSAKAPNLVFVVDPETREVKWHTTEPFIRQHDPDYMGDGWIGVFDNNFDRTPRGALLGGSRIVAIQPHTDSTRVLFPTAASEPFYTSFAGKWERLPNGNMLLMEAAPGRVAEVTPGGRTVWDWVQTPYDSTHVPHVLSAKRYRLSRDEVSAWSCASNQAEGRRTSESLN